MSGDFYIGYRKTAPPALARFVRTVTIGIVVFVVAAAALIGALQQPADKGRYDVRADPQWARIVVEGRLPFALTEESKGTGIALLAGSGKHGPPPFVAAAAGQFVGFNGATLERDAVHLYEVRGEVETQLASVPSLELDRRAAASEVTLEGELIDTKCFLGVMNPGRGKIHRGCASLCLRGGVPPGLAVSRPDGSLRVIVLNFLPPGAPALNPEWAGRVLRVSGALEYLSGLPILRVREIELR